MTRRLRWSERLVRVAAGLVPAVHRRDHREQWLADVRGAAEIDLSPLAVSAGALRAALDPALQEGRTVHPIGPLAIALRLIHGEEAGRRAVPIAVALLLLLLAGLGLLLIG